MQDVAHRLLAALQAEGYGKNVTIAGSNADVRVIRNELSRLSISSMQIRQESESSVMLGFEFENEKWTSSFWNEVQPSVNQSIRSQSVDQNNTAAADDVPNHRSYLQVLFRIGNDSSLSNESSKGVTYPSHLSDVMAGISF
jgi:hypothetical protein